MTTSKSFYIGYMNVSSSICPSLFDYTGFASGTWTGGRFGRLAQSAGRGRMLGCGCMGVAAPTTKIPRQLKNAQTTNTTNVPMPRTTTTTKKNFLT